MQLFRKRAAGAQDGVRAYLDYAGAMPVLSPAQEAYIAASALAGNPGALHADALAAKASLDGSRRVIAYELGVKAHEIVFTSGGTEGNNLAVLGTLRRFIREGGAVADSHWVTSALEHPSVLECFRSLESQGGSVTYLAPSADGRIDPAVLARSLRKETVFVSIGWANGEIGTVQPLGRLSQAIRMHERAHQTQVIFHADAGQAPLYISPQMHTLGADLCTLDGGKLGAPRGAGALFVRDGARIDALMYGGEQESGLRPGTENVALAAGLAAALAEDSRVRAGESKRLLDLRESLISAIKEEPQLEGAVINGTGHHQLPHLLNISLPDIDTEYLTLALDRDGFSVATKSACKEGEKASHVVLALTGAADAWRAASALRISMGSATGPADCGRFVAALARSVREQRERGGAPVQA